MVSPIIKMPNTEKHSGVSGIPTQLLVLHSGESPLRGGYAQSLTQWANVPLNQGGPEASWHWFVDPIAIVSMVDPNLAAWHASEANPLSEGFEQSGYARYTRAEWLTSEGLKQIDNLGWIMALRAKANGIPAQWLTTAQVNAITSGRDRTTKGLCTHRQIDPETRTDPGDHYPFDVLTARINAYMGGAATVPQGTTTTPKELFTVAQFDKIMDKLGEIHTTEKNTWAGIWEGGAHNGKTFNYGILPIVAHNQTLISAQAAQIKGLVGAITALAKGEKFDEAKLLAGVQAAAEAGVKSGIENGIALDATVTVKKAV